MPTDAPRQIGPYAILGELGRGGMGVVFRARHATLGHEVALKVVDPDAGGAVPAADLAARLRREAQAAARLAGHPAIVAVHDVGEGFVASDATNPLPDARRAAPAIHDPSAALDARPVLYLAMDLIEGRSLDTLLAEEPWTPRDVAALGATLGRALHHAHTHGVLHRDVKPGNVLVGRRAGAVQSPESRVESGSGTVGPTAPASRLSTVNSQLPSAFLSDFGLARATAADPATVRLTQSGMVIGTPAYMSPEQVRGETVDARTDVYGLGATLYEALTGRPPCLGDTTAELLARTLREPPPRPRQIEPGIPADLEAVVMRCLEKAPADRYATAAAVADDCDRIAAGRGVAGAGRRSAGRALRVCVAAGAVVAAAWAAWAWHAAAQRRDADAVTATRLAALEARATAAGAAYAELVARSLAPLQRLLDRRFGAATATDATRDALDEVARVAEDVARRHPEARSPAAWLALARCYADDLAALPALEAAADAAGDDPFPLGLLALAHLARMTAGMRVETSALAADGATLVTLDPTSGERARAAAFAALDRAAATPLWPHLRHGREQHAFATGARALAAGDLVGAESNLAPLLEDPLLGAFAAMLLGSARARAGDVAGAATAYESLARRGWPQGAGLLALSRCVLAGRLVASGGDAVAESARAIAAADLAVATQPGAAAWRNLRATVRVLASRSAPAASPEALAHLEAAQADFDVALHLAPDGDDIRGNRAKSAFELASLRFRGGQEAGTMLGKARDDLDALLAAAPGAAWALRLRAKVRQLAGEMADAGGADGSADYAAAVADATSLVAFAPDDPDARQARADATRQLARRMRDPQRMGELYGQARDDLDAVLARVPTHRAARLARGLTYRALANLALNTGKDGRPDADRAVADLDAVLTADPEDLEAYAGRATIHHLYGDILADRREDPRPEYAAALADYEAGLRLAPESWQVRAGYGRLLERVGRYDEAIATLEAAARQAPHHPMIREWLAGARARMGR